MKYGKGFTFWDYHLPILKTDVLFIHPVVMKKLVREVCKKEWQKATKKTLALFFSVM